METNKDNINAVKQGLTGLLVKLGVGETVAQWIVNITVAVCGCTCDRWRLDNHGLHRHGVTAC